VIPGSNPAGDMDVSLFVSVVCCQVSASGRSLAQRSPTECDREASTVERPWPTRGCCTLKKKRLHVSAETDIRDLSILAIRSDDG
jgi:hypothetical protein